MTTPNAETVKPLPANPARPPIAKGPRLVGDPFANLPPEIRARLLKQDPRLAGVDPTGAKSVGTTGTWGTSGASVSTDYGTVMSARLKRKSEKEKYLDNNGETVAYFFYDYSYEGSIECLIQGALEPGDTLSIGGQDLVVNDAEKQWEYKGWAKYSVNAEKHDGVTLTAPGA